MKRHRKREWFDDDAFWRDLYPLLAKRFGAAGEEVVKVLALTQTKGKAVLDLGCGPGRHAIALARRGIAVTGVDRTRFYLEKARAAARRARVRVEWVQADMRDFCRPGAFDLAVSMLTSFGYFDQQDEDLTVLRNIFASLRPGGSLLIDLMGKEVLARIAQPTTSERLNERTTLVMRHEVLPGWTRIRNEWLFIRDGRVRRYRFDLSLYSGLELKERLDQAGFAEVELYGDLDGAAYGSNAQRLIAVGRRLAG